jgi:16S rRNA (uracil1498-N3)-methyltransferase
LNRFYQPGIPEGHLYLDAEESKHCIKVLRKRKGDSIEITDGVGFLYRAIITHDNPARCEFRITDKTESPLKKYSIHLAIAPTKNTDRIEWMVEKCVELGVDCISFVHCHNSERAKLKLERIQKLAASAMKQSLQTRLPVLNELMAFNEFVERYTAEQKFIAYVDPQHPHHLVHLAKPLLATLLLIGPEGDFTQDEIELANKHQYQKVSLGTNRLRTETAGLAACHTISVINEWVTKS